MLIPMLWSAIVALLTGAAVYYNCTDDTNEYEVGFFIAIMAIGWAFTTMLLCLACGM